MFDITSSKLLILAIVALIVVGPKDLPVLLRTVAKYLGIIRKQASEFRAQLDEALRESEYDELKKEFESVGHEIKQTIDKGAASIDSNVKTARLGIDNALEGVEPASTAKELPPDSGEGGKVTGGEPASPASKPQIPEKTGT